MLSFFISRLVRWSTKHPFWVLLISIFLTFASAHYVTQHFQINTDINTLIKNDQSWQALAQKMDQAFPLRDQTILAVVEAPSPELANQAASELAQELTQKKWTPYVHHVALPSSGPFFDHNGLLFLNQTDLTKTLHSLSQAKPLLNQLVQNPSLSGLSQTLTSILQVPLLSGQVKLADLQPLLIQSNQTIENVLAHRYGSFSWQALMDPSQNSKVSRAFVTVEPVLDFNAIQAGAKSSNAIKQASEQLQLKQKFDATVRLTGELPLADDEFSSIEDGMTFNIALTIISILTILWFALRSKKMIAAVFCTLLFGLLITAALGLMLVGSFNMISIAFMVLFIGLGADFIIQYAVKYREARHKDDNLNDALVHASKVMAVPLTLAVSAVALSFFSFIPTAYQGVSELGIIAGIGILIAYLCTITLFPALLSIIKPKSESKIPRFSKLARVDQFLADHRRSILITTFIIIIAGLPLLAHLHFDFNPLNLKDPNSQSMATLLSLKNSPEAGVNDITILKPSLAQADQAAKHLKNVPEVGQITTLSSFVPADQTEKIKLIQTTAQELLPVLNQKTAHQTEDDMQRINTLKRLANQLSYAAEDHPGPGAKEAQALSASLMQLANAPAAMRDQAEAAFKTSLQLSLTKLQNLLTPSLITLNTLPYSIQRNWIAQDGQALVQVSPKQNSNILDDQALKNFASAVKQAEPDALGGPISILHSADIIIHAFFEAGCWALLSISILLWITLRRLGDVFRTLIPLIFSGLVTLELCVILGISLNFANIIALPLMLGVGVAFKIYFVVSWRKGQRYFLQSSLTYAVLFSAGTTIAAFGSLWLSHHTGTASMGKLLTLSLFCTLIGAILFQPVLMGKPRSKEKNLSNS